MSVVVDTSAWIERLTGSKTGQALAAAWPQASDIVVPTLVQLELAKWLKRSVAEPVMDQALAYLQHCRVAPLDSQTALRAADICMERKLSTADAIIYATAEAANATLLTCDAHFRGLPGVTLVPKQGPAPA